MEREFFDIAAGEFPPGGAVKCGNRLDLPKRDRVHAYSDLGPDVRNEAVRGFVEGTVQVCTECGTDRFTRAVSTTGGAADF